MATMRFEKTFSSENLDKIRIVNPAGKIVVVGQEKPDIFIDIMVSVPGADVPSSVLPKIRVEDGVLRIRSLGQSFPDNLESDDEFNETNENPERFSDNDMPDIRNEIKVYVPSGMSMDIRCRQGVIDCQDASGFFQLKTLNGPIRMNRCSGKVVAKTTNGPLAIQNGTFASMKIKTINGPVRVYPDKINGDVQIKTVNGPIRLSCPSDANVSLTVKSGFGPVRVSSEFSSKVRSFREFKGSLNNPLHLVKVKSASGPVSIFLASKDSKGPSSISTVSSKKEKTEDPFDIIDRMLQAGKITPEEADRLKAVL